MQENLKKKWNISDEEYRDATKIIVKYLGDITTNVSVMLAIAELLGVGDIESEENDDKPVTIKDFNELVKDNTDIVVRYRNPNDQKLCVDYDTPKNLEHRQIIKILDIFCTSDGKKIVDILVSICDD